MVASTVASTVATAPSHVGTVPSIAARAPSCRRLYPVAAPGCTPGGQQWQVTLRALCVVEALLKSDGAAGGECRAQCDASIGLIEECVSSVQSSVKDRAGRVLKLLGHTSGQTPLWITRCAMP